MSTNVDSSLQQSANSTDVPVAKILQPPGILSGVNPHCATYMFPPDLPNASGTSSAPGVRSRGHTRSVSHGGGVQSLIAGSSSAGTVGRPSALKSSRGGHQRAFSQGQINEQSGGMMRPGHSRVGSRTDFILPPGHKDVESTPGIVSAGRTSIKGHSRQASRSESIYTLRRSETPGYFRRFLCFMLRRSSKNDNEDSRYRTVVPNHIVPPKTPRREHPNGKRVNNKIRTTKYTLLSFLPRNLLEQFHRVANLYFIFIVLLNWFPAINAFGKEIAMIPVLFVLGVTAVKDLFEDRRRHASDKRINNSTCRIYKSDNERYRKVLWKDIRVGDVIHLSNNEMVPADILLLRSSDPNGMCYIDTSHLDGETNLKLRQVARGFVEKQEIFEPSKFRSTIEVENPSTKIYRFHGTIVHPNGERVALGTENLLLRECLLKNTDFVEGIVVYAGHETKAMLNNGGPRYKRSKLERQMNLDVIWCVLILIFLCVVGAIGCKMWFSSYENKDLVPFITQFSENSNMEGLLAFWTFIIILQILIPLSLYVTIEMSKLIQVYHIHNDVHMFDNTVNKGMECRALNITEELGQVQYVFTDKTGTLTENKMIFRRCCIGGIDYSHQNFANMSVTKPGRMPIMVNPKMQEELGFLQVRETIAEQTGGTNAVQSSRIQEFLLLLALCNTVIVSRHPHHDSMNASGVIESVQRIFEEDSERTGQNNSQTPERPQNLVISNDRYSRLTESRSITPSPPFNETRRMNHVPSLSPINSETTTPTGEESTLRSPQTRPNLLALPSLLFATCRKTLNATYNKSESNRVDVTPSPGEFKPIFEAESPDELALVDAAFTYHCRLLKRTPQYASVAMSDKHLEFDILHVLPFDSTRKCMSVVFRRHASRKVVVYCKGADSTVLSNLAPVKENSEMKQIIHQTQQHLNSYAREGLRVLVMAKRVLTEKEYKDWVRKHEECELSDENRERKIRESYSKLESNLTLVGATGIEDRLQEGVPETLTALINAGIVVWVLTGDKPETAINIAYSSKLFVPQMELLKLMTRSRDAAESTIMFYLSEIEKQINECGTCGVTDASTSNKTDNIPRTLDPNHKRALVVDGKTLTFILDKRSNLTKPFLRLSCYCTSVLCCRATPLQKAYIVKVVKEELRMRTLAIGDGANDVSMIHTADVGIGISGQEGMQAVMAADFALTRFKYLERFLLVHGHWCYDRLARMILYFFYKNAAFVFLIFWYQLYCGFSGAVMIDQMYLMLYNLMFTSLPPLAIGVYDQDAPDFILQSDPALYRRGRLGLVYKSHSFWLTMADALYQSIAIYFTALAAYHGSDVDIWEFGTTITTSCMFTMLVHVVIETRSWTILHFLSMLASIGSFFAFSWVYNLIQVPVMGLPSTYYVIQRATKSYVYWLVILLTIVIALLPRLVLRVLKTTLWPSDVTQALIKQREIQRRGEGFLVSWSRSSSASSIYRTTDIRYQNNTLTRVG